MTSAVTAPARRPLVAEMAIKIKTANPTWSDDRCAWQAKASVLEDGAAIAKARGEG